MAELRILQTADGLVFTEHGQFDPVPSVCRLLRQRIKATTTGEIDSLIPEEKGVTRCREYSLVASSGRVLIYEERI